MFGALKRGFRNTASLILVRNVVGELQPKRTLAASRGFLAAARLSCLTYCHRRQLFAVQQNANNVSAFSSLVYLIGTCCHGYAATSRKLRRRTTVVPDRSRTGPPTNDDVCVG